MKKLLPALLLCQLIFAQEKLAVPYRQGNLYGLCDTLGNVLVKPVYEDIEYSRYALVNGKPLGRFMVIDKGVRKVIGPDGKVLVDGSLYDHIMIDVYNPAVTVTQKGNKYGMLNGNKLILKPEYEDINLQYTGIAVVQKQGKFGVYSHDGTIIYPVEYDDIDVSDYGNELYYTLTKNGNETTKVVAIPGGIEEGLYDLIDTPDLEGDEVKGAEVRDVIEGSNYCIVRKMWKWALYDTVAKKLVLPFDYFSLRYLEQKNGQHIFLAGADNGLIINQKGERVLQDEFSNAREMGACVLLEKDNLWGAYIFNSNKPYMPCRYENLEVKETIETGNGGTFVLFYTRQGETETLIGQNGVEYYKP